MPNETADTSSLPLIVILCIIGFAVFIIFRIRRSIRRKRAAQLMQKYNDQDVVDGIMKRQIWQGMTEGMLLDSWGNADEIDRNVLKTKTKNTLKYGRTGKNRFRNRVFSENGYVVGWDQKK